MFFVTKVVDSLSGAAKEKARALVKIRTTASPKRYQIYHITVTKLWGEAAGQYQLLST